MPKKSAPSPAETVKVPKLLAPPKSDPATEKKTFDIEAEPKAKSTAKAKKGTFWFRELSLIHFALSQAILLILGLAFLAGLYFILNPDSFKKVQQQYTPVTSLFNTLYVTLDQPEDNSLVFNSSVVISGKTTPKSTVIIASATKNIGIIADGQGSFSTVFPLTPGLNLIQVAVFDSKGNTKIENRSIYYSVDKI